MFSNVKHHRSEKRVLDAPRFWITSEYLAARGGISPLTYISGPCAAVSLRGGRRRRRGRGKGRPPPVATSRSPNQSPSQSPNQSPSHEVQAPKSKSKSKSNPSWASKSKSKSKSNSSWTSKSKSKPKSDKKLDFEVQVQPTARHRIGLGLQAKSKSKQLDFKVQVQADWTSCASLPGGRGICGPDFFWRKPLGTYLGVLSTKTGLWPGGPPGPGPTGNM
jgi:hypothetical protein